MSTTPPITIVGAGLAGTLLACYLGRAGYPVDEVPGRDRIGRVARLAADAVGQFLQPLLVAVDPDHRVPGARQDLRDSPAERSARAR